MTENLQHAGCIRANHQSRITTCRFDQGSDKKGSSRFPGEGSLDFQKEVFRVPETIGHALDHLDSVVHALQQAGMHGKTGAGEDAADIAPEVFGEALSPCQCVLEQIDRSQRLVGGEQLLQLHGLAVLEEQPAAALDHLARWFVIAQEVGLVDEDTVDHLTTVARHHMEQVVHHFGLRAVPLHFQVESGVHVHGDRLDVLAMLTGPLEEWANRLATGAVADPQHACSLRIHDHRGVAMALVQGELVHPQAPGAGRRPARCRLPPLPGGVCRGP